MHILLTGATGFVGKKLTTKLLECGHSVYVLIRSAKKGRELYSLIPKSLQKELFIVEGDVTLDDLGISNKNIELLSNKIDTIYHIAAFLSFEPNDKEKIFEINVNGTKNVLDFAKRINCKRFLHISTAYTLGESDFALEELHSLNNTFVNHYEESKCHAEHLVFKYKDEFDISIFRPSIIVGDSVTGEAETSFGLYGFIKSLKLLKRKIKRSDVLQNSTIKLLCDPQMTQNFVPVNYVIDVLTTALIHAEKDKIYHITTPNPPTNQEIMDSAKEYLEFYNLNFAPVTYEGELTKEEIFFNESIKVFLKYLDRNITFIDSNTNDLLTRANIPKFYMDREALMLIISKGEAAISMK